VSVRVVVAITALAACGRIEFNDVALGDVMSGPRVDARVFGAWTTPVPLPLNIVGTYDDDPSITEDGKELFFNSGAPRTGYIAGGDIFVSNRSTTAQAFTTSAVVAVSTGFDDTRPMISADGLALYFGTERGGARELYVATRATRQAQWDPAMPVGVGGMASAEATAIVVNGGRALYFDSNVSGNGDLYVATRATTSDPWGTPELIAEVSDPIAIDGEQWVSEDGLLLMFGSNRAGSQGYAIWQATRASTSEPFSTPTIVGELDTPATDSDPFLTPDLSTMYFASDRNGVPGQDADIFVTIRQ
jgi:hypothetical protein